MNESTPRSTSPLAETFDHAMKGHYVSRSLMFAGPLFIVLGVAIAVRPEILVWVMALTFAGFGCLMLVAAVFVRRLASRMQSAAAEFRRMRRDSPSS